MKRTVRKLQNQYLLQERNCLEFEVQDPYQACPCLWNASFLDPSFTQAIFPLKRVGEKNKKKKASMQVLQNTN